MKKVIMVVAVFLSTATTALASYQAVKTDNEIIITNQENKNSLLILSGYDENGNLKGSQFLNPENGKYSAKEIDGAYSYRIGDADGFFNIEFNSTVPSPAAPAPTETPKPRLHPAYEKEKDAKNTIAVVKNISSVLNDGDNAYKVDTLVRGEEQSFIIPENAPMSKAPDYYNSLTGSNASVLKPGDIVYIPVGLNGKTKEFALVHRPLTDDIITSSNDFGVNFEKLISTNGVVYGSSGSEPGAVIPYGGQMSSSRYNFAFGTITDKYNGGFTLRNKGGQFSDAIDVAVSDNTIVYTCDMTSRVELSIGKAGSIIKSPIPKIAYDEEENITYSSDYSYNYAFARIVNGVATEVVIYTSYNE